MKKFRNGVVDPLTIASVIVTIISIFYGGAITEAETNGKLTNSISYSVDENKTTICKEFYPKLPVDSNISE